MSSLPAAGSPRSSSAQFVFPTGDDRFAAFVGLRCWAEELRGNGDRDPDAPAWGRFGPTRSQALLFLHEYSSAFVPGGIGSLSERQNLSDAKVRDLLLAAVWQGYPPEECDSPSGVYGNRLSSVRRGLVPPVAPSRMEHFARAASVRHVSHRDTETGRSGPPVPQPAYTWSAYTRLLSELARCRVRFSGRVFFSAVFPFGVVIAPPSCVCKSKKAYCLLVRFCSFVLVLVFILSS